MHNDDWIHTEILGDDDKKTKKGSFISFSLIAMLVVSALLLFIAFRGLFMGGGKLETDKKTTDQTQQIAAPKTDDTKAADTAKEEPKTTEVTYTVKAGDTLAEIAAIYKLDFHDIADANKIPAPYDLKIGQKLVIPGVTEEPAKDDTTTEDKTTSDTSDTTKTTSGTTYRVVAGDTLGSIGAKLGVDYKAIAAANNLSVPYPLEIGQKLIIPEPAAKSQ